LQEIIFNFDFLSENLMSRILALPTRNELVAFGFCVDCERVTLRNGNQEDGFAKRQRTENFQSLKMLNLKLKAADVLEQPLPNITNEKQLNKKLLKGRSSQPKLRPPRIRFGRPKPRKLAKISSRIAQTSHYFRSQDDEREDWLEAKKESAERQHWRAQVRSCRGIAGSGW
jgi:hypothetical protein